MNIILLNLTSKNLLMFKLSPRTLHLVMNWLIYDDIREVYHFDRYIFVILEIWPYLSQILIFFNVFGFILKVDYRSTT